MYNCQIIADSVNPNNQRITTFQVTFPRSILSEINTHGAISKNGASSRAIPIERMLKLVEEEPYIPVFTKNKSGMQGIDMSDDQEFQSKASKVWLEARDSVVDYVKKLSELKVHKQDANRILEPFMWHTGVLTATDWANFFALRAHPDAHPGLQTIACMMADAMESNEPTQLEWGEWHTPYITTDDKFNAFHYLGDHDDLDLGFFNLLCKMSSARCARVSYMRQQEIKSIEEDIERHDSFANGNPRHASPLEHQAQADPNTNSSGNFRGNWLQYRHTLPGECVKEFKRNNLVIKDL